MLADTKLWKRSWEMLFSSTKMDSWPTRSGSILQLLVNGKVAWMNSPGCRIKISIKMNLTPHEYVCHGRIKTEISFVYGIIYGEHRQLHTQCPFTVAIHDVDLSGADIKDDVWITSSQDKVEIFWLFQQTVHSNGHVEADLTGLIKGQLIWQPRKIIIYSM